jgi:hypothetical protein
MPRKQIDSVYAALSAVRLCPLGGVGIQLELATPVQRLWM